MSLDEKFVFLRTIVDEMVEKFFHVIARWFGYPANPGMLTTPDLSNELYNRAQFLESLPRHNTFWPPAQRPTTWFEMIFGPAPKLDLVPRYIYENKEEGFYNFYIENYKNLYFLPDWLSEFLQVKLNICLDITILESIREIIFLALVIFSQMLILRISLSWFIYINPYRFPWSYLAGAVDWTEDVVQGLIPTILGVNISGTIFLGILGVLADSLNHLVFTMPFLPSEAEETQLLINKQLKDVLVFHYLPILWYRYPIPNDLREFWYRERPDILEYMETFYHGLNMRFLPDSFIDPVHVQIPINSGSSTNMISELNFHWFLGNDSFVNHDWLLRETFGTHFVTLSEKVPFI
jgi:uncharacterized protein YggT (Ycf19 family)